VPDKTYKENYDSIDWSSVKKEKKKWSSVKNVMKKSLLKSFIRKKEENTFLMNVENVKKITD
jgi:hypothetical protein